MDNMSVEQCKHEHKCCKGHHGFMGGVYGLAFLGALVYYIQHSTTFWMGVLGFFKAVFWPAMIIYKVLDMLKM